MRPDPLAPFRRGPVVPSMPPVNHSAQPAPEVREGYVAFGARDRVERLNLWPAMAPHRTPAYQTLLDIAHDGKHGTNFVLYFSFMSVAVRGKNLQKVVSALQAGTASFIQEFDPEEWPEPPKDGEPLIEQMNYVFHDPRVAAAGVETQKNARK